MKKERLDKILASQNLGSRKEVGTIIRSGRTCVNGVTVRRPEQKVDPQSDVITVDHQILKFKQHLYIMMNKPAGVLSASRDPHARTVVDLLPPSLQRRGIFPAGRLDKDTRGLLILTDDGAFAHRMLSPKSHVMKWYEAVVESPISKEDILSFRTGVKLSNDITCLPAELSVLQNSEHPTVLVGLHEGKFHQVKRMFLSRNNRVLSLRRIRIGDLFLDTELPEGNARELDKTEIELIFQTPHG